MIEPLSIYLHIPFCSTKCSYCAFNTYTNLEYLIPAFVDALANEVEITGSSSPYAAVHTIYFGGGTPSLLTAAQFEQLLTRLYNSFPVVTAPEITIETNPNDLGQIMYLRRLRDLGINRLSIGMQSAVAGELKLFERRHDLPMAREAVANARRAGFENISLDLIYGFPQQTMESWQNSLHTALALEPEHLSLYALGVEDGTRMFQHVQSGQLIMPEDDLVADMYEYASEFLANRGFIQYEISNWSRPGYESRHNLQYWRNDPYLGLGPGAHGYACDVRYETVRGPAQYIDKVMSADSDGAFPRTPATLNANTITGDELVAEILITNLRLLIEGLSREKFKRRTGSDVMELHGNTMTKYENLGLLTITNQAIHITEKGRLLSNMVFRDLI